MKDLPKSEIYEQEYIYMPRGIVIKEILETLENDVPKDGTLIDLMCGPGYILGNLAQKRPDITLEGIDIGSEFIHHAKEKYPHISFQEADVLSWSTENKYDVIVCTAGIHHLPYDKQPLFLQKISNIVKPDGFVIFADPYIDNFNNKEERKLAGAKLGYEYLVTTIRNKAPDEVISAAVDVLYNDVMGFEYKTSVKKLKELLDPLFTSIIIHKTRPSTDSEYGDYYLICKK